MTALDLFGSGRNSQRAPCVGHGVASIDGEVQQRHLELVRVSFRRRQAFGGIDDDADLWTCGACNKPSHLLHKLCDVDRNGLERLTAGEGEETLDESLRLLGRLYGPRDQALFTFAAKASALK